MNLLLDSTQSLPKTFTREQVCSGHLSFQGLSAITKQYGEVRLDCFDVLNYDDRQRLYDAKRKNQDTHAYLMISHAYYEPSIPLWLAQGVDWTKKLSAFREFVELIIQEWQNPIEIFLAGDGQSVQSDNQYIYNDPVGWTYGYDWLYNNLPNIFNVFKDLMDYILWMPGFDSVFYGWEPEQNDELGGLVRRLNPKAHFGMYHNTGHIPVGNGPVDYAPGGIMQNYDVIMSEFDWPIGQDSTWQVVARMAKPYNRPVDQPVNDDPNPPYYLNYETARGPYFYWKREFETYRWVRNQVSLSDVQNTRNYLASLGPGSLG